MVKLADQLLHQGNIPGAIEEFNRALTLPGDKTPIYQGLADAYRRQQLEESRAYAKQKK